MARPQPGPPTLRGEGPPWLQAPTPELLGALLEAPPAAPLRSLPGRTTFTWTGPDGGRYVVKRFVGRAGRLVGPLLGRAGTLPGALAEREHAVLAALSGSGVPVPRPMGWVAPAGGALARAAVVMALVPHRESLRQRLARVPDEALAWAPELAALVAGLHRAGWYHQDLYLEHVVIAEGSERLVLLDLARARRQRWPARVRWFQKDLGALASTPGIDAAAQCLFFERYCAALGVAPGARPRWLRATLRRAARIQRHVPRFADPETREGAVY